MAERREWEEVTRGVAGGTQNVSVRSASNPPACLLRQPSGRAEGEALVS